MGLSRSTCLDIGGMEAIGGGVGWLLQHVCVQQRQERRARLGRKLVIVLHQCLHLHRLRMKWLNPGASSTMSRL